MKKYLYHYNIKSISGKIVFNLDKIPLTEDQPNDQYIKLVTTKVAKSDLNKLCKTNQSMYSYDNTKHKEFFTMVYKAKLKKFKELHEQYNSNISILKFVKQKLNDQ